MHTRWRRLAGMAAACLLTLARPAAAAAAPRADLVFRGGPIYTVDPVTPQVEAVAVVGGRIAYVGDATGVAAYIDRKTRVVELEGRILIPGFIDSHARLLEYAQGLHTPDLSRARSYEEVLRRVAREARRVGPHEWVLGRGWDEQEWIDPAPIRLLDLQNVTGSRPVCLFHATDNALLVNMVTLGLASLDADPPDPPGGRIQRSPRGGLTGVLVDEATRFITGLLPQPSREELIGFYREAAESCAAHGITQVHDMSVTRGGLAALEKLADEGKGLPVSVYAVLTDSESDPAPLPPRGPVIGRSGGLTVRAVRLVVDGGLATRGAALLGGYADSPRDSGNVRLPQQVLNRRLTRILRAGFQPILQATGDAALLMSLDAMGAAADSGAGDPATSRVRLEAARVLGPRVIERIREAGALVSAQPFHTGHDARWVEQRLGSRRLPQVDAWKSLVEAQVPLAFGTDAPGGPLDPVRGFFAAVTRFEEPPRPPATPAAPGERLSRSQALEAFTLGGARAAFLDNETGSIVVGKLADLTVLSRDIMTIPEGEILSARPTMTVVGGRVVYEAAGRP